MRRLVLVALFFEVGVVLIFIPWSAFWDRNYFASLAPPLGALITNNFVRGAVSGLGLLNVAAGLVELASILLSRYAGRPPSIRPSGLAQD